MTNTQFFSLRENNDKGKTMWLLLRCVDFAKMSSEYGIFTGRLFGSRVIASSGMHRYAHGPIVYKPMCPRINPNLTVKRATVRRWRVRPHLHFTVHMYCISKKKKGALFYWNMFLLGLKFIFPKFEAIKFH